MNRFASACLTASLSLCIAGSALAAPKARAMLLQPLADELAVPEGQEQSKDVVKGLNVAERCLKQDRSWQRSQENQVPVNQLYESLSSAVVCWQGAEKKAQKAGEPGAPLAWWTTARARYIESFRTYLWAIDAKLAGDRAFVCRRLGSAMVEKAAAEAAGAGLADKYQQVAAQALAAQLSADIGGLAEAIEAEHKNQGCGK